jgi:TraM recognition site of TraD and TraG
MSQTLVSSPDDDRHDVYLGIDTKTGEEVWLPYEDRVLGVTMIGKSGTGKSTILENLVLADLANGTPGLVIDPHGQLAQQVIRRATAEQAERIVLLEAIRTKPFGLNLLAVREPIDEDDDPVTWAADSVVGAVKRLYGEDDEFLPRLERYLDLAVRTLIPSGLTLLDAPRLFTDKAFRNACLSRVPDYQDRESLRGAWAAFDRLRPGEQITHTEALVNRLERLLAPPLIQGIVGSKETTVPFDQILNGDKMLIVSLPSEKLSPERSNFIGALMLCALADRIFARSVVEKPPRLHLYLDEYQRFATTTTSDLLTQGRKYGVGLTLAHQDLHQIRDWYIRNSARHAGTLILLAVTRPDAEELAGEFPVEPREEWIETITEVDGTEPKLVPSPTAAEDVYIEGHSNPDVDLAARSFMRSQNTLPIIPERLEPHRVFAPGGTRNLPSVDRSSLRLPTIYPRPNKSDGVPRRPGGVEVENSMPAVWLNSLLYRAMTHPRATDPDVFFEAVQDDKLYAGGSLDYDLSKHFDEDSLRKWLRTHVAHLDGLRSGHYIDAFREADGKVLGAKMILLESHESLLKYDSYRELWEILDKLRQRLRWLWILYDGLAKDPVLIPSGEQQPRMRTRHIVHPAQTQQDALNEFAAKLVNPAEQHVAHVRMPRSYHSVKLVPPLRASAPESQVHQVRKRSQEEYHASGRCNEQEPPETPTQQQAPDSNPRRITRRPQAEEPMSPEPQEETSEENGEDDDSTA